VFLSVRELELRKVRFEGAYAPGQIDFGERKLRQSAPFDIRGTAELIASVAEIRVRGRIAGSVACDCDRCLEEISFPVEGDFDVVYEPAERYRGGPPEAEIGDAESEIGYYEGDGLELDDVAREQILLWLPMQRLCRPDCRGLCPVCGRNRNLEACSCRPAAADDRWSALRELSKG
jgi:uncharacterized protein